MSLGSHDKALLSFYACSYTSSIGEKFVALTFDDGPRRGTTERLLDGLKERGAKATFFLIMEQNNAVGSHTV